MKEEKIKFIKSASFLFVIFIFIISVLNYFYIVTVEPDRQINRKEAQWQEYKKTLPNGTLDYGFFGDSHTGLSLNPQLISNNSFNFAGNGEDYTETYYKLKKIVEDEKIHINNILLEIDTHTFSDKLRTGERLFEELRYYKKFIPYSQISKLKGENIIKTAIKGSLALSGNGPEIIRYLISEPVLTEMKLGWTAGKLKDFSAESEQEKRKIVLDAFSGHFNKSPNLLEERSLSYFLKTLELAKENGINVIFVKYPLVKEYDDMLEKNNISRDGYYDKLFEKIDKIISDYAVLNYYDEFFANPDYFGDADHLNRIGSTVLSEKVSLYLQKRKYH